MKYYYNVLMVFVLLSVSFGVSSQCTPPAAPTVPSTLSVSCGDPATISPTGSSGNYAYFSDAAGNNLLDLGLSYTINAISGPQTVYVGALSGGPAIIDSLLFTNCGAEGRQGPTQAQVNSEYAGTQLDGEVNVSGGIQEWVVPATGVYEITSIGAQGGRDQNNSAGGAGASLKGEFSLNAGDVVKILVGQQGVDGVAVAWHRAGGGGGGTFVWLDNGNVPLIIAAGGSGAKYTGVGEPGLSTEGSGNGGTAGSTGAAGGGWLSNGAEGRANHTGGLSPLNGGIGGNTDNGVNAMGGFGGGGAAANDGGGGGGHTGGNGPHEGGQSFNAGSNQVNQSGVNEGHGMVIIKSMNPPCISALVPVSINVTGVPSPTAIATTNPVLCGGDTDITASGGTGDYIWFSDPNGTNVLGTDPVLNTGALTTNTTFYVSSQVTGSGPGQVYEFTNAGADGREGPTQAMINAAYAGTTLDGQVTSNNGIQSWEVPSSGNYSISAVGAQGGGAQGGLGAELTGEFMLNAGDVLEIIVGQQGLEDNSGVGGGGGSFVVLNGNPLVIAGVAEVTLELPTLIVTLI
jgi:hypothetical protein